MDRNQPITTNRRDLLNPLKNDGFSFRVSDGGEKRKREL